jgi:hypothetical protein
VNPIQKLLRRLQMGMASLGNDWQTVRLACAVARRASEDGTRKPVIFFNASTRIRGLSLNAAYSLLTSWAIRLQGVPVVHFVCQAGMSRCLQGTNQDDVYQSMPCQLCLRQSRVNYTASNASYFKYQRDPALAAALADMNIQALMQYEHPFQGGKMPLGTLVLASIRWRLRRLTLTDEESTRFLYREFIQSAWTVAREFNILLDRLDPQAVVAFNGQFFPEATARWLCLQRGIRVFTHESGLRPLSGYFTPGEAPAWPIYIPDDFELSKEQNARLDAYLEKRFQGRFSMAGVQFWPEMKGLGDAFLQKAAGFKQIVPVFTNVIFDTSQSYSNALFPDMFAWLEAVLESARRHPETLFVIRAHPDEVRPGKTSLESVAMWVEQTGAAELSNLIFIAPDEFINSYELIRHSKFVMIYNSTIGLESSILGVPVLCAGSARFKDYGAVFFPASTKAYLEQLEEFLSAGEVKIRPEHPRNSRRFFYFHYFITSLRFDDFVEPTFQRGFVKWKRFPLKSLAPSVSPTMQALVEGILHEGNFLLKE